MRKKGLFFPLFLHEGQCILKTAEFLCFFGLWQSQHWQLSMLQKMTLNEYAYAESPLACSVTFNISCWFCQFVTEIVTITTLSLVGGSKLEN